MEQLEDEVEAAESHIKVLEAQLALLEWDLRIARKEAKIAGLDAEILKVQRPGFLRRHFRLCGQIGAGAVVLGAEQGEVYPVASVGLCLLP